MSNMKNKLNSSSELPPSLYYSCRLQGRECSNNQQGVREFLLMIDTSVTVIKKEGQADLIEDAGQLLGNIDELPLYASNNNARFPVRKWSKNGRE